MSAMGIGYDQITPQTRHSLNKSNCKTLTPYNMCKGSLDMLQIATIVMDTCTISYHIESNNINILNIYNFLILYESLCIVES